MRHLLPAIAVVSAVAFTSAAFAANHQGQRYANVTRAQAAQNDQAQPYALTGADQSHAVIQHRASQPRPR